MKGDLFIPSELIRNMHLDFINESAKMHKSIARIIPVVMSWDGIVTKFFGNYIKMLNLQPNIVSYLQSRVIMKTLESLCLDYLRGNEEGGRGLDETDDVMSKMLVKQKGVS